MTNRHDKILFWGCFMAMITTSYAFISRLILWGGQFATDFGLDKVSVGELQGAGLWSFGISIILFSPFLEGGHRRQALLTAQGQARCRLPAPVFHNVALHRGWDIPAMKRFSIPVEPGILPA
ncbi:MAG: hypothetical protein ACREE6_07080 [Limisphaerales bacterium]